MGERSMSESNIVFTREDIEVIEEMLFLKECGNEKLVIRGKRDKEAVERFYQSSKILYLFARGLKEELGV